MTIASNLQKRIAGMAQRDAERKGSTQGDPVRAMEALAKRALARTTSTTGEPAGKPRANAGAIAAPATPPPQTQAPEAGGRLPQWPSDVRAVPNPILRSALFGAIKRGRRRAMQREDIPTYNSQKIVYTGHRLDQGDLDVWQCVLQFASAQAMGDRCQFTAYAMLQMLGRADTGGNRQVLDMRLSRLKATALCIVTDIRYPEVSLIDKVERDRQTREYRITINPEMRALFQPERYTHIDWAIRRTLDGKPLAQWLHGFYSSHRVPSKLKVATLHRLCGSDTADVWKFSQTLRGALKQLAQASSANGAPFQYTWVDDNIHTQGWPRKRQRHVCMATTGER